MCTLSGEKGIIGELWIGNNTYLPVSLIKIQYWEQSGSYFAQLERSGVFKNRGIRELEQIENEE